MSVAAYALAAINEDDGLGDWAGLVIEDEKGVTRKVRLAIDSEKYIAAMETGTGHGEAISQIERGIAAWWVYTDADITASAIVEADSPVTIGAPETFQMANEVITFNHSSRITTKYRPTESDTSATCPYDPLRRDCAAVVFRSRIISSSTQQELNAIQTSPGVFELSEPGYGALVVSYSTKRRLVKVEYDALLLAQFAQETLLTGSYPEDRVTPVMVLLTSSATQAQTVAQSARTVADVGSEIAALTLRDLAVGALNGGAGDYFRMLAQALMAQDRHDDGGEGYITLTEVWREWVTQRIYAPGSSSQYVDINVARKINMTDSAGRLWKLNFSE